MLFRSITAQANRAIQLLSDDKLHASIAEAARKTATRRFCSDLIIPQYERYYEEVVGQVT